MNVELNPLCDLSNSQVTALLSLVDTPEKRQQVVNDLGTLSEYLADLFIYADSPLSGHHSHPLYSLLHTSNDMVGILMHPGERLTTVPGKYGNTLVVEPRVVPIENDTPVNPSACRQVIILPTQE